MATNSEPRHSLVMLGDSLQAGGKTRPKSQIPDKEMGVKKVLGFGVLLSALLALSASSYGRERDFLLRFEGAIGVNPAASVTVNGTTTTVNANVVRGVSPAGAWRIADLDAKVGLDGRIRVHGRGLLLANGNGIGTNGNASVFATLFCGPAASATASNSTETGVALDSDGDFTIDDVLTPAPLAPCTTPVLLIRTSGGAHPWFAAGIPR